MNAADVIRILRADPDAYAEAFRVCAGTLWQRRELTGLLKADDMVIVNRGVPEITAGLATGQGRAAAAAALGQALRGMVVSRAAREHGIGVHPAQSLTGALLAAALDGVDWDEVGSKILAATLAQLGYAASQASRAEPAGRAA